MKKVFIGHRGVGKTQLLARHKAYYPDIQHFDLDQEIEKSTDLGVYNIFQKQGEQAFREIEAEVFKKLFSENEAFVIALGAGFDLSKIPEFVERVYVSRRTDQDGRIFFKRPRLEVMLTPLDEYRKRYAIRQPNYLAFADVCYHMPEGLEQAQETEKKILTENFEVTDAYYTLSFREIKNLSKLTKIFKKIELRTDLIDSKDINKIADTYPNSEFLISIRGQHKLNLKKFKNVDIDYLFYTDGCNIVSSHSDHVQTGIKQLSEFVSTHDLKLCPTVENFEDLIVGYEWQQQDPARRSFLPRSLDGKWLWYRQLGKYLQKINFIRNFNEVLDQPSLFYWLVLPQEKPVAWGAVLGAPIYFSRSPVEQLEFFTKRKTFFTKIDLSVEELSKNILFLNKMGLSFAAVTSPLKETLFKVSDFQTETAGKFLSANTLQVKDKKIFVHNTDADGFQDLVKSVPAQAQVAVWGGGGTLEMMKAALPHAIYFSSQTAEPRDNSAVIPDEFDFLIWAAPRSHKTQYPDEKMKIKHVIDLNYTDNSMGLEFAVDRKIGYTSGLTMFKTQASEQRRFWQKNEEER